MHAFIEHSGVLAPIDRCNIDTDAIIPSREMKKVSRNGLSDGLFAGWRYLEGRTPDPDFVLNRPEYRGASLLAAGPNFGCGSSREHAVWALQEFGIRAILAPSFGSIFERNCVNNGILPVRLDRQQLVNLTELTKADPQGSPVTINLAKRTISVAGSETASFDLADAQRELLLNGWDPIDQTLESGDEIETWERRDRLIREWAYPDNSSHNLT